MWLLRSVVVLVGIIAFLWLSTTNASQRVDFVFFTKEYRSIPLYLFMLVVFAAGMVFAFLVFVFSELQLRSTISRQRREVDRLERELAALRNLPLEEGEPGRAPVEP